MKLKNTSDLYRTRKLTNGNEKGHGFNFGKINFDVKVYNAYVRHRQLKIECHSFNHKRVTDLTMVCYVNKGFAYIFNV